MRNILLMTGGWPGDRFLSAVLAAKPQLEAYAAACGSDVALIDRPLDPSGRRSLFAQKLLIARVFSGYDIVVHVDHDVLIPRNLPNIFSCVPENAGLAAVVDPRGGTAYQKAWGYADWTREGHQKSFEKMGLFSDRALYSINGGVIVLRPQLIADLLEAWYFDDSKHNPAYSNDDETPMAYISQTHDMFAPLDHRFNRQVFFALHETHQGQVAYAAYRSLSNRIHRKIRKSLGLKSNHIGYGRQYKVFVEDLLRNGNLVHFAGKYLIPRVNHELLVG